MADNKALFGHVAVDLGFISRDQLLDANRLQNDPEEARPLGELLLEMGWITPPQLQEILGEQWRRMAQTDESTAEPPAGVSAPPVSPATPPPTTAPRPAAAGTVAEAPPPAAAPIEAARPAPIGEIAGEPPAELARLLRLALERNASDVHMHSGSRPRFRVHGRLETAGEEAVDRDLVQRVVDYLLDGPQAEELAASGQIDLSVDLAGMARFRVNVYRQQRGPDVVMRVIPHQIADLGTLGLPRDLARFTTYHQGLVLITGPSGCGKTTTLAALVEIINQERRDHVIIAEDPIEYVFEPKRSVVNQRQVGLHSASFPRVLRAALREDPDVIVLSELRDLEAISLALTAAETGHLVLGTLHTGGAIRTINRLIGSFPANEQDQVRVMMAESLKAIISQRLIPRADGNGRVAAVEILVATRAISNLIREKKVFQIESAMQTGRSKGMRLLAESLRELVQQGVITAEEARRHA